MSLKETLRRLAGNSSGTYGSWPVDAAVLFVLTVVFCLHYYNGEFIFQGDVFLNMYMHSYPELFRTGWDPYAWGYLGWYPIFGALFPLNVLMHLVLDNVFHNTPLATLTMLQINAVLSLFLLAFFLYLLLRRLGRSRAGAMVGAIIPAFTGFHIQAGIRELDLFYLHSYLFVPLVMIFLLKAHKERSVRWVLAASAMVGLSLLGGGNSPMFLFIPYLPLLFLAERPLKTLLDWREVLRGVIYSISAVVGGILLGAVLVLPALKYMDLSSRAAYMADQNYPGLPPFFTFMTMIFREWWQFGYFDHEADAFIGLPALLLAITGLYFAFVGQRGRTTIRKHKKGRIKKVQEPGSGPVKGAWYMGLVALCAIISINILYMPSVIKAPFDLFMSALSIRFPYRNFMVLLVPVGFFAAVGFDSLKGLLGGGPKRYAYLSVTGLAVAVFCYFGLQYLRTEMPDPVRTALTLTLSVTVAFYLCMVAYSILASMRPGSAGVGIIGCSLVLLLFAFFFAARPDYPPRTYTIMDPVRKHYKSYSVFYPATLSESIDMFFERPVREWKGYIEREKKPFRIYNMRQIMRQDVWAPAAGVEVAFEPIKDPAASRFLQEFSTRPGIINPRSPLWDLYNVKYFRQSTPVATKQSSTLKFTPIQDNANAFERYFITHGARYFNSEKTLKNAFSRALREDIRHNVYLVTTDGTGGSVDYQPGSVYEEVEIKEREIDRVVLEVDMKGGGFLVASEPWFPAWRAEVDGRSEKILRAYGVFWAVALEPGPHTVVFTFKDWYTFWGKVISITGFIIVGALFFYLGRKEGDGIDVE